MKQLLFIVSLFISFIAIGQTDDSTRYLKYTNSYGIRHARGWFDSVLHVPYVDTTVRPARPGMLVMRPADKKFYGWNGTLWSEIGSGSSSGSSGITSLGQGYGVTIVNDSTYNVDSSVILNIDRFYRTIDSIIAVVNAGTIDSIIGNSPITIDFTNRRVPVINYAGDTTRYFIFESPIQASIYGDTVYVSFDSTGNSDYSIAHHSFGYYLGVFLTRAQADQYYISYDSALGKFVDTGYQRTDSFFLVKNGVEFLQGVIPASAAGGISEVIADWGLINVNDSTLKVDSFLVASRARLLKVLDSIQVINNANLALKLNISDTASMLSHYVRRVLAGTNVTVDNTNAQYPVVSTSALATGVYQVITATAGQTAFTFTSVPTTSATYNVFINGSACPKSYYSVASNTITFSTGLTLNDVIMIQGVQ